MGTDDTKPSYVREEVIDCYFEMKILGVEQEEDDAYLKFLLAAQRIWKEQRGLHIQMARDIARWAEETEEMNQMVITQNLYRPRLGTWQKIRAALAGLAPEGRSGDAFLMSLLTTLLVGNILTCVFKGWEGNWIGVPMILLVWCCALHTFTTNRRKDS